VATSMIL